jgi:hypothetical protein
MHDSSFLSVPAFLGMIFGGMSKAGKSDNLSCQFPSSFALLRNISKRNKEKVFRLYRCFGGAKENVREFDIICHFRKKNTQEEKIVSKRNLKQTMNLNFWCFSLDGENFKWVQVKEKEFVVKNLTTFGAFEYQVVCHKVSNVTCGKKNIHGIGNFTSGKRNVR